MSGKKRSEVVNNLCDIERQYSNPLDREIKNLNKHTGRFKRLFQASSKQLPSTPEVDCALIDQWFDGACSRLLSERMEIVKKSLSKDKRSRNFATEISQCKVAGGRLIEKFTRLKDSIESESNAHYMDSEWKESEKLKTEFRVLQEKVRTLSSEQAGCLLDGAKDMVKEVARIDGRLLELSRKSGKQASEKLKVDSLRDEIVEVLGGLDRGFLKIHGGDVLPAIEAFEASVTSEATAVGLQKARVKLLGLAERANSIRSQVTAELDRLRESSELLRLELDTLTIDNPLSPGSTQTVDEFYDRFGGTGAEQVADFKRQIQQVNRLTEQENIADAKDAVEFLSLSLENFHTHLLDDCNKIDSKISIAVEIRDMLRSKGLEVDVIAKRILEDGIKIETKFPRGAYFKMAADSDEIESDIDVISSDCIGGMDDVIQALGRKGIDFQPRSYERVDKSPYEATTSVNKSTRSESSS